MSPPLANAQATTIGRLLLTNSAPDRVASGYGGRPELYQVRANGTLWRKLYAPAGANSPEEDWSQIGKRTDWVSLSGAGGVVIGLTRDNVLWTWGIDLSHPGTISLARNLTLARYSIGALFGGSAPRGGSYNALTPALVKEPRPLMQLLPALEAKPARSPVQGPR